MEQHRIARVDDGIEDSAAQSIEQLQSFCRGEMSAVETYRQAIASMEQHAFVDQLRQNLASHEARIELLRRRISELGGKPPASSGPWGTFAKALEGTASALGQRSALSVLEEGEEHGLADYRDDLFKLDVTSRRFVSERILPEQVQTHRILANLQRLL